MRLGSHLNIIHVVIQQMSQHHLFFSKIVLAMLGPLSFLSIILSVSTKSVRNFSSYLKNVSIPRAGAPEPVFSATWDLW